MCVLFLSVRYSMIKKWDSFHAYLKYSPSTITSMISNTEEKQQIVARIICSLTSQLCHLSQLCLKLVSGFCCLLGFDWTPHHILLLRRILVFVPKMGDRAWKFEPHFYVLVLQITESLFPYLWCIGKPILCFHSSSTLRFYL